MFLPHANEVWGKVMFLQVSVILLTGGTWSRGGVHGPGRGGGWWVPGGPGQYASYWNAFLFNSHSL